ncbi:recombinase family protein [Halorubrum sp. LN27]|uniref:recombinase family protein n=1 Tax=Halorubrum sp. LN27 TaxID=2801032 RepID=UPI001F21B101|nr:recombinase family protein [Halorubrum sp. LN27]
MANAAVYARVSTRDQELETQRENLLDYARDLGLDVDADHVLADKSIGTDTDREGYCELMQLVEDSVVDETVATVPRRLWRRNMDSRGSRERTE